MAMMLQKNPDARFPAPDPAAPTASLHNGHAKTLDTDHRLTPMQTVNALARRFNCGIVSTANL